MDRDKKHKDGIDWSGPNSWTRMENLSANNKQDERLCAQDGTCAEGPNLSDLTEAANAQPEVGNEPIGWTCMEVEEVVVMPQQGVADPSMCADDGTCAEGPNLPNPTEAADTDQDAGKIYDL